MEKINLLYFGKDETKLTLLKEGFQDRCIVFQTSKEAEALNWEEHNLHLLIIDNPKEVEAFLDKSKLQFPETIRLLISNAFEIHQAVKAFNEGAINFFLKDWSDIRAVENAIHHCLVRHLKKFSDQKELETLRKANAELSRFIYSASHDLRSPLMSILGIVQLKSLGEDLGDEHIKVIENSALKLDKYIRNIIDFFQSSGLPEVKEEINFSELLSEVTEFLKHSMSGMDLDIEIDQAGTFIGDSFRLRVILTNLISNAAKFRKQNGDRHKVKVSIHSDQGRTVISVMDNGIGIDEGAMPKIYDMFFKSNGTYYKQGSGIGLFLVKECINQMKGRVEVASQSGSGTEFIVTIPNAKSDSALPNRKQHLINTEI